ncbi:hypothetical protein TRIUR3_13258 [Triticum urartu]|uniref:Uncharacterized protein n=1 Tax=Triticum urartu TaxID=4572 RepID=M7ZZR7_TRIUA|nr:hypothetical protein TRIUR3_13258 [Triticum urartu]
MERKMSSSGRHLLLLFSLAPALLLYHFALRSIQPFLRLPLAADNVPPPRSAVASATRVAGDGANDSMLVQGGGGSLIAKKRPHHSGMLPLPKRH